MKIQFDQLGEDARELVINASERYGFTIDWFMGHVNACNASVCNTAINAIHNDEVAGA